MNRYSLDSQQRQIRLWELPSVQFTGYQGTFSREQTGRGVKLITHLHLLPRIRLRRAKHILSNMLS